MWFPSPLEKIDEASPRKKWSTQGQGSCAELYTFKTCITDTITSLLRTTNQKRSTPRYHYLHWLEHESTYHVLTVCNTRGRSYPPTINRPNFGIFFFLSFFLNGWLKLTLVTLSGSVGGRDLPQATLLYRGLHVTRLREKETRRDHRARGRNLFSRGK